MCSRQQNTVEVIGEQLKLAIFGKTDVSKIQHLYSVARHYAYEQSQGFKNYRLTKLEHNMNLEKVLNDLDAAIEEKMPNLTSPDYNRHIAMKAISYGKRLFVNFTMNRQYAEKALFLIDSIKDTPEGITPYLRAVRDIASFSEQDSDVKNAIMYLNNAMITIDEFEKAGKKRLSVEEIFGGKPLNAQPNWLNEQRYHLSIPLFHKYLAFKNEKMMEKWIFPALQGIYSLELKTHSFLEVQGFKPVSTVRQVLRLMDYLTDYHYFAQVNHLVSILMFHLVKNGRSAGSIEELSEINVAKSMVCYWYAQWAHEILWHTFFMANSFYYGKVNKSLLKPIRTKMIRFDAIVEPGVEQYENQFPVDVIESAKEWKKVVKNGKAWCQRAIDYSKKEKQTEDKVTYEEEQATKLMKSFFHIEKKQIF